MIIRGGKVFSVRKEQEKGRALRKGYFKEKDLFINAGRRFADKADDGDQEVFDASGCYVIPGLVDVHTHGCAGCDFSDADPEGLKRIAAWEFSQGVTAFCPTSMTLPVDRLAEICASAGSIPDDGRHALAAGIHLEGPFVSMEKMGAQNPDYILSPDPGTFEKLQAAAAIPIRLITIAPELPGAIEFIDRFHNQVHISLGHTAGTYEDASRAYDHGADHATHLYNAMTPYAHREPGIIGAAAERPNVFAELICDGLHIHPSAIRATFAMFGADRVVLISDSMRAAGLPDGESELGGQTVYKKGLRATLKDGRLAASVSSLMDCMRNVVRFGIPLEDAVLAATDNPARSIGLGGQIGCIEAGARGSVVILDRDLNPVQVF